ncbi:SIS domain-containing protein [Geobacillus stearothermophilus]|uniref:SIS domain-containing protein n=1 Tax=Geobacillus stearothermophilus TaxID=1422 RepID=UPI002E24F2EB|nr:SIS domain-containing protein [Geobacillus stearothermophilus]
MLDQYFQKVNERLELVLKHEKGNLKKAAYVVSEAIQKGGIIQLFGCGHSHILTEEVFYRAGGLVPIKPIFFEPLMLHEGAVRSSMLERMNDFAKNFIDHEDIRPEDVFFVLSTSGRNPVPIDVALAAKAKGAYIIAVTSLEYSKSQPSRHKSGRLLYEVVDLVIDNHSVKGDAILAHQNVSVPFAPTSTVIGSAILNAVFAEAIALVAENGVEPPVFLSGNIEGADEHNRRWIEKYKARIPLLVEGHQP